MPIRPALWMCWLSLLCAAPALASAVTLTEPEWAVRSLDTDDWSPAGTSSSFLRLSSAGQPGAALLYNAVLRAPGHTSVATSAIAIANDLTHGPAQAGRIGMLSFSQSLNLGATDENTVRATTAFLLSQVVGGVRAVYLHAVAVAPVFSQWQTVSASGLVASDFVRVNLLTGALLPGEHPVFDAALPTTFGVGVGAVLDNGGSALLRERLQVRIDNLVVTVSPIPEPSTVWMGLVGLPLLLAAWKHRASGFTPGLPQAPPRHRFQTRNPTASSPSRKHTLRKSAWLRRLASCAIFGFINMPGHAAVITTGSPSIVVPAGLVDPVSSLATGLPPGYFLVPVGFAAASGLDGWSFDLAFDATVAAPADLGGLYQSAYQALSGSTVSQILSSGVALPGLLDDVSGFFEQPQDGSGSLAFLLFAYAPGQEGADPGVRVVDGLPPTAVPEPASLLLALLALGVLGAIAAPAQRPPIDPTPERTPA